jgi:carbon monoxide dehydrogenase subunit G
MKMNDQREIAAPRAEVWAALQDPEVLKACVPGAQEVTGSPEEGYDAVVVQKVGPVKATFKGQVTMSDMVEGESLHLAGEGKGGAAGFAKGGADVKLEDSENGTLLTYDVEAKVGGKLAQLGSRLIDGFAKKMADQFFTNLQNALEAPEEGEDSGEEESEQKKGWFRKLRRG